MAVNYATKNSLSYQGTLDYSTSGKSADNQTVRSSQNPQLRSALSWFCPHCASCSQRTAVFRSCPRLSLELCALNPWIVDRG